MSDRAAGLGLPGVCVAVGALALCCGAPVLIGALVAGGGVAFGDWALVAIGAVLATAGLVLWLRRRGACRAAALPARRTRAE